jgi:hypothetical protein
MKKRLNETGRDMHDKSTSKHLVFVKYLQSPATQLLGSQPYKLWSSIVTLIWDGNSVYILMCNLRCTANNTKYSWIIFRINADRKIIRRILYLFVQTAVYIVTVQGPNAAHGPYWLITPIEESYLSVVEVQSSICLKEMVKQRKFEGELLSQRGSESDTFNIHVTATWNLCHLKFIWRNKRLN